MFPTNFQQHYLNTNLTASQEQ